MPDLPQVASRAETLASSCRTIAARLREADPLALALSTDAYKVATSLIRDLDPRTPPADVARSLMLVASHASAVLVGLHDGDVFEIHKDAAVALNLTGMVGYHLLDICGELATVMAYGADGGDPS